MSDANTRLNVSIVTKYTNKTSGEEKSRWNKVGVAWPNKLGGYNVKLDFPVAVSEFVLSTPLEDKPKEDVAF